MQTKVTELEIFRTSPYEGYSVSTLDKDRITFKRNSKAQTRKVAA